MNTLINFIKNKKNDINLILKKLFSPYYKNVNYTFPKSLRSDSEELFTFNNAVSECLINQKKFNNFKRNPYIMEVVETVGKKLGYQYLKLLKERDDGILKASLKTLLISDDLGNPYKYKYDQYPILMSPVTLRYLKVTSDLKLLFGKNFTNIAEIGAGYGGQALINDYLLNIESIKIFDLPNVNMLIQRYLNNFLINGLYKTTFINNEGPSNYDLVISNYAFSEIPRGLQIVYIDKVLSKSKMGYITMNTGIKGKRSKNKLSLYELNNLLPEFKVLKEEPFYSDQNYIIVWGFDVNNLKKYFKELNLNGK